MSAAEDKTQLVADPPSLPGRHLSEAGSAAPGQALLHTSAAPLNSNLWTREPAHDSSEDLEAAASGDIYMKSSLEHLPERKQRELARVVEIIHEEFAGVLDGKVSDTKKRGRILKIILFGSYARGTWVDEPHTMKGYRSDYDILVIVSTKKLAEPEYWDKVTDRLMWDKGVKTPVGLIVHGAREVNNYLADGQYFFVDIVREGVILYELDDRPLAEPRHLEPADALRITKLHLDESLGNSVRFRQLALVAIERKWPSQAAFLLHQTAEAAYAAYLLALTNYSPPSHNLKFLRGLAEDQDRRLIDVWPRDQHRFVAWYNILNEAYVKARYSSGFSISTDALEWLLARTEKLQQIVEALCLEKIDALKSSIGATSHKTM